MKKVLLTVFLAVFLLMSLVPFAGLLAFGPSEAAANEVLAQPPAIKTQDGGLNFEFLSDASDWLADRFALRRQYITANAAVEATAFRESASKDVILGKDGWLFYRSTLDDYQGQNLMSPREIWSAARCLTLLQEYAQSRGISFLFTVAPNKNTLYPQYMPSSAVQSSQPGNLAHLQTALSDAGVPYLDLCAVLKNEDAVLYHKLDSHWNNLGAALAHDAIMERLGAEYTPMYQPSQYTAAGTHDGDLYQMLYPAGTQKDVQYSPDFALDFTYQRPIRSPEDQTILTACEGKQGKLLMFRDSFGNTLHTFMAESFGEACFSRAMPYTAALLDSEQPDTLIIEIVERNIPWLAERAPVMPAPIRVINIPQKQTQCSITCCRTQTGESQFCFAGSIGEPLDDGSPVFIVAQGQIYEAFPAGEGEAPFTAYLPVQASSVQVAFLQNGILILSQPISCQ